MEFSLYMHDGGFNLKMGKLGIESNATHQSVLRSYQFGWYRAFPFGWFDIYWDKEIVLSLGRQP